MSFQTTKINSTDKTSFYHLLNQQAKGLLHGEDDLIACAANFCSLLFHAMEQVNWVGFYLLKNESLLLGPFQGQVACTKIPLGQGVCGRAFSQNKTLRIADVSAFKGHITCDTASASEIVIPLNINGKTIGVLDIDSPILNRFDEGDQLGCEQLALVFCQALEDCQL
jgi:GAF domain-containing protein